MDQQTQQVYKLVTMPSLHETTLLILGYGSIGRDVARIAKTFGMHVIGVKRNQESSDEFTDTIIGICELNEFLPQADFLIMALPNHPSVLNIVSTPELNLLKPSSILINVGRGNSLDEDALLEALNTKKIAGAALDVFKIEPILKTSPL